MRGPVKVRGLSLAHCQASTTASPRPGCQQGLFKRREPAAKAGAKPGVQPSAASPTKGAPAKPAPLRVSNAQQPAEKRRPPPLAAVAAPVPPGGSPDKKRERQPADEHAPAKAAKEAAKAGPSALAREDSGNETIKLLTTTDPSAPSNLVRFSQREGGYRPEPLVEHLAVHYSTEGWLMHKGSEDAAKQLAAAQAAEEAANRYVSESEKKEEGAEPDEASRQLRNQFNFTDRAVQTVVYPPVDRAIATEPFPTAEASGACSPWHIYQAYQATQAAEKAGEEAARQRAAAAKRREEAGRLATPPTPAPHPQGTLSKDEEEMVGALQILERMGLQNALHDVTMDFKYWDDAADGVREQEGTLLPLWDFACPLAKHRSVTALAWSPVYDDLFAVAYGSFDARKQGAGAVACFSLKNASAPEYLHATPSGAMCVAISGAFPSLLAAGLYDGSVLVLDMRAPSGPPLYASSGMGTPGGGHADCVWAVRWGAGEAAAGPAPTLFSAAADGRVAQWTLSKAGLTRQDIMGVQEAKPLDEQEDEGPAVNLAAATCMDFHKAAGGVYLVGSEEGAIARCSTGFASETLGAYPGHYGAVYALAWNPRHPRAFLSASADWSLKVWDAERPQALLSFDLGCPVGDAAWAPYSATVFAGCGDDGRVQVFDLADSAREPLCSQKIVRSGALTRLAFNPSHPVLLVGDDRGSIACLKLSPNLRKPHEGSPKGATDAARLDHVFGIALKNAA